MNILLFKNMLPIFKNWKVSHTFKSFSSWNIKRAGNTEFSSANANIRLDLKVAALFDESFILQFTQAPTMHHFFFFYLIHSCSILKGQFLAFEFVTPAYARFFVLSPDDWRMWLKNSTVLWLDFIPNHCKKVNETQALESGRSGLKFEP